MNTELQQAFEALKIKFLEVGAGYHLCIWPNTKSGEFHNGLGSNDYFMNEVEATAINNQLTPYFKVLESFGVEMVAKLIEKDGVFNENMQQHMYMKEFSELKTEQVLQKMREPLPQLPKIKKTRGKK